MPSSERLWDDYTNVRPRRIALDWTWGPTLEVHTPLTPTRAIPKRFRGQRALRGAIPGAKPEDRRLITERNAPFWRWFPKLSPIRSLHPTFGFSVTYDSLNVEVFGRTDGPVLLLLHGWGSCIADMRPLGRALSDTYRIHALDLPGHGASPPPPEPWGVPEHADLVHEYIEQNIGARVTVVGHSNGGRIALFMAGTNEHADLIERLVLISPSGVEPKRSLSYYVRSAVAKTLKAPIKILPSALRAPAEDWLRHTVVWRALGSADYNAQTGVMRDTFVKTVNRHLNGTLKRIEVPTLLFWGTQDKAVSRRQMHVIEDAIDDCGLVELQGAGHFGHLDQPKRVVSGIRHFLENS